MAAGNAQSLTRVLPLRASHGVPHLAQHKRGSPQLRAQRVGVLESPLQLVRADRHAASISCRASWASSSNDRDVSNVREPTEAEQEEQRIDEQVERIDQLDEAPAQSVQAPASARLRLAARRPTLASASLLADHEAPLPSSRRRSRAS